MYELAAFVWVVALALFGVGVYLDASGRGESRMTNAAYHSSGVILLGFAVIALSIDLATKG